MTVSSTARPAVPVVASYDLHLHLTPRMVRLPSVRLLHPACAELAGSACI